MSKSCHFIKILECLVVDDVLFKTCFVNAYGHWKFVLIYCICMHEKEVFYFFIQAHIVNIQQGKKKNREFSFLPCRKIGGSLSNQITMLFTNQNHVINFKIMFLKINWIRSLSIKVSKKSKKKNYFTKADLICINFIYLI